MRGCGTCNSLPFEETHKYNVVLGQVTGDGKHHHSYKAKLEYADGL